MSKFYGCLVRYKRKLLRSDESEYIHARIMRNVGEYTKEAAVVSGDTETNGLAGDFLSLSDLGARLPG